MRLDKFLEQGTVGSRKAVKRLLASKQVRIAGQIVMAAGTDVDPLLAKITVAGKEVVGPTHTYYMLNKPQGVVSAVKDQQHQTVIDLIAKQDQRPNLFPVGRLDRDTEGLIVVTDNGKLGYQLLQPQNGITKEYEALINEEVTEEDVLAFKEGIIFHCGYQCLPADLKLIGDSITSSRISLVITEGKFHQVKKMFLAVGKKVNYLKRVRMASLTLDDALKPGDYRQLTRAEIERLSHSVLKTGGK